MSEKVKKRSPLSTQRKVAILLRDRNAVAEVYAKLSGDLAPQEVLIEAIKRVESGSVYADKACTQLVSSDFIEVADECRTKKREDEFVFLIDRQQAPKHIVGARIIK